MIKVVFWSCLAAVVEAGFEVRSSLKSFASAQSNNEYKAPKRSGDTVNIADEKLPAINCSSPADYTRVGA